jgi:tryptophan synthase beta subunit
MEGIIPAFETAHAFAVLRREGFFAPGQRVVVNVSGRGDKDMERASQILDLNG